MNVIKGASVPNSYPALYLKDYRTLVIADLHIGYESALKAKGVFLPQASYPYMKSVIEKMLNMTNAEHIIFVGDVKHEFGKPSAQEWVEVQDLLASLIDGGIGVHVVRGNHDNYILAILNRLGVHLHDPYMQLDNIVLIHGDKDVQMPPKTKTVIIGHEHPAVSSRDLSGSRYKFKCFLVGKHRNFKIVVMPALSPLSLGVGINETRPDRLLSPLLRASDIDSFTPIVVEENIGVFRFPQIGLMRSIARPSRKNVVS